MDRSLSANGVTCYFGFDIVEIAPPLDDSLASMYAGRKLLTEAWGCWAEQIGKLEKFSRR